MKKVTLIQVRVMKETQKNKAGEEQDWFLFHTRTLQAWLWAVFSADLVSTREPSQDAT